MGFFKRLFGISSDPTADWPAPAGGPPPFNLQSLSVGPLRFGSPFSEARAMGKPEVYKGNPETSSTLLYARAGYSLDYEEARLVFVTYHIGPDEMQFVQELLGLARPNMLLPDGTMRELHQDTDAEALVAVFGKPESAEVDEDESILTWERSDLTIEAELNERSRLTRLNIFLTN